MSAPTSVELRRDCAVTLNYTQNQTPHSIWTNYPAFRSPTIIESWAWKTLAFLWSHCTQFNTIFKVITRAFWLNSLRAIPDVRMTITHVYRKDVDLKITN